jgi:hypothetical protein
MSRLKGRHGLLLLSVALLVLIGLGAPGGTGQADTTAGGLLWLNPPNTSTAVGSTTTLALQLDSITNVYGIEVYLTFDPTFLEVVGAAVIPGTCPQDDFVVTNTADNMAGTIEYVVAQLNPTLPCDGGLVADIEFLCKAETSPSTVVSIVSSIVSDPDGIPLTHTTQDATVECVGGFVVVGTVGLQSWPGGPEGISVILRDSGGATVDQQVVGPTGAFSLTAGDVAETYSVEASYPRYLSARASGITGTAGDTVDIGHATLPAGDLNGNGVINILDITIIAGNFGKSSPQPWGP